MGSPHYTQTGNPRGHKTAFEQLMREEFEAIESGIETMALMPVVLQMDDMNTGDQYSYGVAPFSGKIKRVVFVISGQSATGSTVLWAYNHHQILLSDGAWLAQHTSDDPAGSSYAIDVDDDSNAIMVAGDQFAFRSQGQGTGVVPAAAVFLISGKT